LFRWRISSLLQRRHTHAGHSFRRRFFSHPENKNAVYKACCCPDCSRPARLSSRSGWGDGTLFRWRISSLLQRRQKHLWPILCILFKSWRIFASHDDVWHDGIWKRYPWRLQAYQPRPSRLPPKGPFPSPTLPNQPETKEVRWVPHKPDCPKEVTCQLTIELHCKQSTRSWHCTSKQDWRVSSNISSVSPWGVPQEQKTLTFSTSRKTGGSKQIWSTQFQVLLQTAVQMQETFEIEKKTSQNAHGCEEWK